MADYTILVADYDPKTTDLVTQVFAAEGLDVQVAKDGMKAIEAFKKYRPILTLIEFMMPKRAGLEVCRDVRHSPEGRDANLVVMSSPFRGRTFRADAVRVYGATETVEKPLDKDKLNELLVRLVRPRMAELGAAAPQADFDAQLDAAISHGGVAPEVAQAVAVATGPAADRPQDAATAQALQDVVQVVLGSEGLAGIAPGTPAPAAAAAAPATTPPKTTPQTSPKTPVQATEAHRPSAKEEQAGESEIEDHIDSLLDF